MEAYATVALTVGGLVAVLTQRVKLSVPGLHGWRVLLWVAACCNIMTLLMWLSSWPLPVEWTVWDAALVSALAVIVAIGGRDGLRAILTGRTTDVTVATVTAIPAPPAPGPTPGPRG